MRQINVHELISLLHKYSRPDDLVEVEGCDCMGMASGIVVRDGRVMIARTDSSYDYNVTILS